MGGILSTVMIEQQLTAMMTDTNQFQPLNNFTLENQISSNFLDKKVNAKKSRVAM